VHYNFTIDRELLPEFLLRVGYAGSQGSHNARDAFISPVLPIITMPDGRLFFPGGGPRLNPNFATIEVRPYDGKSFYNALLLKVERRFSAGHRLQLSYTYSKSVDDFSHMSTGAPMPAPSRIHSIVWPTGRFPTTTRGTTWPRTSTGNCLLAQDSPALRSS
jgi:hypothetical protein